MKYRSHGQARRALLALARKGGRGERKAYRCPECGAWHLTSCKQSNKLRELLGIL